jgi:hypothetical protein
VGESRDDTEAEGCDLGHPVSSAPPRFVIAAAGHRPSGRAPVSILSERGGRDGDIGAAVEKLDRRAPVTVSPRQRNAEQPDCRSSPVLPEILGKLKRSIGGLERVVRLERRQITDEVDVSTALNVDERPDEGVIRMETARQDDR